MGPPVGRAPVADDLRPQTSPITHSQRRVPSPQPDEHISHVSVNSPYPNTQVSSSQPRIHVPPPDQQHHQQQQQQQQQQQWQQQQQQQQWQQQQHQQTIVNNQYSNTQSTITPDQHSQYHIPQNLDPSIQGHMLNNADTNIPGAQYPMDEQVGDDVDGPPQYSVHTNVRFNVSTEKQVCESTPDILTSFIVDRMEYDGYKVPSGLSNRGKKNER